MSWNRPTRALAVGLAVVSLVGLAGCGKKSTPALSGEPNQLTTTTTAGATTTSAAGATTTSTTSTTAASATSTTAASK
jgi:hypothetical protein